MKTSVRAAVAILLGTAAASAGVGGSSAELLVIGPVESINAADRTATILEQRVHTTMVDALAVGNTVAVFGTARADGTIEASTIQFRGVYVPGATSIFISGTVQRAEHALGRVVVNGVTVDLTSAMSYGMLSPAIGSKLAISGTQPVNRGLVLVSGTRGSVQGIAGTGSAVNGIAGTGSAVNGIAGTGSALNGIAGTGSAVNGIAGTGSAVNGIAGTGSAVNGIAGTGSAVNGIAGTGSAVNGIAGTGSAVNGIAGTGSAVNGIAGTGSAVNGIAGTGSAVNGIAGTGSAVNGIAGTGVQKN
jgi:hypothetical protein